MIEHVTYLVSPATAASKWSAPIRPAQSGVAPKDVVSPTGEFESLLGHAITGDNTLDMPLALTRMPVNTPNAGAGRAPVASTATPVIAPSLPDQPYVNPFESWVLAGNGMTNNTPPAAASPTGKESGSATPVAADPTQDQTDAAGAVTLDSDSDGTFVVETGQQYLASFQNWDPNLPSYPHGTVNPLVEVPCGQDEVLWVPSTIYRADKPLSQVISEAEAAGYKVEPDSSAYEPSIVNGVPVYPS
jgi:hypothetical protein